MARTFIGSLASVGSRSRVYLSQEAVEVDEIEGYRGTRSRVLLDEVRLVTLDRRRSKVVLLLSGGVTLCFAALLGLALAGKAEQPFLITLAMVASLFLLVFIGHAAIGNDVVTIFGARSKAQISFSLRKRRAREIFALVQERVAAAQAKQRGRHPPEVPPASGGESSAA